MSPDSGEKEYSSLLNVTFWISPVVSEGRKSGSQTQMQAILWYGDRDVCHLQLRTHVQGINGKPIDREVSLGKVFKFCGGNPSSN